MRIKKLSSVLVFLGVSAMVFGQKYIPEDDLYYTPKEKNPIVEKKKQEKAKQTSTYQPSVTTTTTTKTTVSQSDYDREVDAYNRRYSSETDSEEVPSITLDEYTRQTQQKSVRNSDDSEDGYYLNGFDGTQSDFEYAERIRRFHNPKFTIHISDPAYTDIYFLNSGDWNVYVDNSYAYVTPTWTNPWYQSYMWSPYRYGGLSWSWNMNFGSWGYNYPWGYNPGWGWGGPAFYPGWGWGGGHHHYPGHYPGYYPGHRPGWSRDIRYSNGGRTTYGNYGSSGRYNGSTRPSSGGTRYPSTRPSSNGDRYTPGSSTSQPIMRESNTNRGRTRVGTSSGNSTYNRPSGSSTNSRPSGSSDRNTNYTPGSSSRVRNGDGGRSTYTPSSTPKRESSGSSYSPSSSSPSRSSGTSSGGGRSSGGSSGSSRGRTR